MQPRRQQRNRGQPATWRLVFALLAMLAVGAQQLVAATHWHATVAAVGGASGSAPDDTGKRYDCLWCHVAAQASAAAPPALPQALVVPESFLVLVSAEHPLAVFPAPAHAWQSRGPPAI
jgi:hypothetical protein